MTTILDDMDDKVRKEGGFLAALDQSGGSTPKTLRAYGIPDETYVEGEDSMFDRVHEMRSRVITSKSFTGDKVLGAILFEKTMDREIDGRPTADYLWHVKRVVPFLKVDQGLMPVENGVQLMKPIPGLKELCHRAKDKGVYGTKMRSVIKDANADGIKMIVEQQFGFAKEILECGLVPIIEPEVDINSPNKELCEDMLLSNLVDCLDKLKSDERVMLKLTIPTKTDLYQPCIHHPQCIRVVALSGGYSRAVANDLLAKQSDMIASFSRALLEGLRHDQTQEDFDATLAEAIDSIYEASVTKGKK